jgi:ribosomal protein L16 Arg81 hydroxylase
MNGVNPVDRRGAERLPSAFADLISPMGVEEFTMRYWEREHLILHRDDPEYYTGLMTLADMDHLIATCRVRSSDLRVMSDGKETPISELVSEIGHGAHAREAVYAEYRKGATINLLFLEQHWNPLAHLCKSINDLFGGLVHVNTYLTPAGTRGLTEHYDTHDVFVAQVYGSKHWRLYGQPFPLPLTSQNYKRPEEGPGEPVADFTLAPGDLLYMPRGTVHQAVSNETASLHMTIGVQAIPWAEMIKQVILTALGGDIRYRKSLPLGFNRDAKVRQTAEREAASLLTGLLNNLRPEGVLAAGDRQAVLARKPALEGHLLDLEKLSALDLDTKVGRRPHLQWDLTERSDGRVTLGFNGKVVEFPGLIAEELRYIATAELFTAREIPGDLDESSRVVLVSRLVREGFLTFPRAEGGRGADAEARME